MMLTKGTNMAKDHTVALLLTDSTREMVLTPSVQERLAEIAEIRTASGPAETWDLPALLQGATACITGWGTPPLSRALLDASPELQLVAHTAGSIRSLLPAEMVGRRVQVCQAASVIASSVAEMVILQILMDQRELHLLDRGLRDGGGWFDLRAKHPGRLLGGRTVAVIGASRTGRAVIRLLEPFGCKILIVDPYLTDEAARDLGAERVDLETAVRRCDVLTLHAPVLPETEGMVGAEELALMRDGSVLINSARASLVDTEALAAELRSGRIRAALDVFPEEPLAIESEWREMPHAILSPHSAGHTVDAHQLQGEAMVDDIERFLTHVPLHYEITSDMASVLA